MKSQNEILGNLEHSFRFCEVGRRKNIPRINHLIVQILIEFGHKFCHIIFFTRFEKIKLNETFGLMQGLNIKINFHG